MIDVPSLTLAFAAGFVSFVSPCCLPLVPGYLATVTGAGTSLAERGPDARALGRSLLFVATFSLIFMLFGLGATAAGSFLLSNQQLLNTIAGIAMIWLGILLAGSPFVLGWNRELRPPGLIERAGRGGPVVAGAAFAIAWTPCVGPTLGAILSLAATTSGTGQGALLLGVYSAGLAVPFIASALAFNTATRAFAFFRRRQLAIQVSAGVVLAAMGGLVLAGELTRINAELQGFLDQLGLNFFKSV